MNYMQKYIDILNENTDQLGYNYNFFFNKEDRYDWNFYVKLPDNKKSTIQKAVKLSRNMIDRNAKLVSVTEFDEEDLEAFEINPAEHEFMVPDLYDEGT